MINKTHTKYIQSLHHKKFRDEYGVFIAEGPKVVLELLDSREFVCKQLIALDSWLQQNAVTLAKYEGMEVFEVKDFELEKIKIDYFTFSIKNTEEYLQKIAQIFNRVYKFNCYYYDKKIEIKNKKSYFNFTNLLI